MATASAAGVAATGDEEIVRGWREDGYAIVRGVFDAERVARLRAIMEHVRAEYLRRDPLTGKPGAEVGDSSLSQPHHPDYFADRPEWRDEVLRAGSDERVLRVPRLIYGAEPLFRAMGLWFNPQRGARPGNWHRDTQFFFPDPDVERRMLRERFMPGFGNAAQFQIALVPSEDLELVPGSHLRWDSDEELAIRLADGTRHNTSDAMPGAVRIGLDPGDGVIFNPFGLHRGRYHADKLRRTFMVTTTRPDEVMSDRFSRQPWFLDSTYTANLPPASRAFFRRFVDVYGDWWRGGAIAGVSYDPG